MKFTKSEKNFMNWLKRAIRYRKKGYRNHDGRKWITITQTELAAELGVVRTTLYTAVKKLEALGMIERAKMEVSARDHTYSYTLTNQKESSMNNNDTNVHNFVQNCTNNKSDKNNKLFLSKINHSKATPSTISQDKKINTREMPTATLNKTNSAPTTQTSAIATAKASKPQLTVREMWDAAQEVLGSALSEKLTKQISFWLGGARNKFFQSMDKWRSFLLAVKRSAYLMGAKFCLTLKWLLKFATIQKVLEGFYDSFEDKKKRMNEALEQERLKKAEAEEAKELVDLSGLSEEIDNLKESAQCKHVRKEILRAAGPASYKSWLRNLEFVAEDGFIIVKGAGNNFARDMASRAVSKYLGDYRIIVQN